MKKSSSFFYVKMKWKKYYYYYYFYNLYILFAGAIPLSEIQTVFESEVRFVCPEGQIFATGVREINTRCMPGGQWSTAYIPKCQEVRRK